MATESSMSACVGHLPLGRRSFRKQRTVNPLGSALLLPLPAAGAEAALREQIDADIGPGLPTICARGEFQ
jgi:hypothetical protein